MASGSTRDAILALRRDKQQTMDVFETAEPEDNSATRTSSSPSYQSHTRVPSPIHPTQPSHCMPTLSPSPLTLLRLHCPLLCVSVVQLDKKKSEDVVQLDLKPSLAFAKFAGRIYDSRADSSTSSPLSLAKITPLPLSSSSSSRSSEPPSAYSTSISLSSPFEAPVDKFNRLKREVAQFTADLQLIAASCPPQDDIGDLAALLAKELKGLDDELAEAVKGAGVAKLMGEEQAVAGDGGDTFLAQSIAKLQAAAHTNSSVTITAPAASSAPSAAPSDAVHHHQQQQVLSSLDRRVAALERTVGLPVGLLSSSNSAVASAKGKAATTGRSSTSNTASGGASVSHLSYSSPYPDLYTAIMTLHRKLLLLDPARLDSLHRNIKTITADLELIQPSSSTPSSSSSTAPPSSSSTPTPAPPLVDASRTSEMYEVLMRWDGWVGQLPVVVARLRGLKGVVEEAKGLGERVRRMEVEGEAMRRVLEEDREALARLSQSLPEHLQQVERNLQAMQQRIAQLQQRMDKVPHKS